MKTQIIPKSWRDSLEDLREDLSHTVDRSKVKAKYRHGVLRLTMPKTEEAKARRIHIDCEEE